MSEKARAEIGVFGGSGFYSFLEDTIETDIKTPYGDPSDKFVIGEIGGKKLLSCQDMEEITTCLLT